MQWKNKRDAITCSGRPTHQCHGPLNLEGRASAVIRQRTGVHAKVVNVNVNREFLAWLKQSKLLKSPRERSTEIQTKMSGNDW